MDYKEINETKLIVPKELEPSPTFDIDRWLDYQNSIDISVVEDSIPSECYVTRVSYFHNDKGEIQKYITLCLPADSRLVANDKVIVSITKHPVSLAAETTAEMATDETCYAQIRAMSVNESLIFTYERWADVRTCAHVLKKLYGAQFRVKKLSRVKDIGDICITRIA